jgi:hypothetical protein
MATRTHDTSVVEFEVVPDEIDGWDVKKPDEEQAARLRGEEEQADEVHVTVNEHAVHHVDDETRGVRTAFLALAGLLLFITLLIVVISLVGSLTEFGA